MAIIRDLKTLVFAMFVLVLSACSSDGTTLDDVLGETATDTSAAIAQAQEQMADIGQRIQESEVADDLQAAWEDLQADLIALFNSLRSEGTVDNAQVDQFLDDFEERLDEAGDRIPLELGEAWEALRTTIEGLIQQAG